MTTTPQPWLEALASRSGKTAMPTTASSAELAQLPAELRERAMFFARTTYAGYLNNVNSLITRIVSPEGAAPGQSMNQATARLEMKQMLQALNYQPPPDQRGGMQDLSSDARLNLIIRTNVEMAQGHGHWLADQDPYRLEANPAQELYRLEDREVPRNWRERWVRAGGKLFGDRMIALKNDPVWTNISAFGLPYPPYDFNSGMWVRDISLDEAITIGLMSELQPAPEPADTRGFNADLQASIQSLATPLQDALLASLGSAGKLIDGVLHFIPSLLFLLSVSSVKSVVSSLLSVLCLLSSVILTGGSPCP